METGDPRGEVVRRIAALLEAAEEAHGLYETSELDGVYDEAWAPWYAAHVVDNGIEAVLGHELTADRLAAYLSSSFDDFKAAPPADQSWAWYTARQIVDDL